MDPIEIIVLGAFLAVGAVGWFLEIKKKKQRPLTAMDAVIRTIYGANPPKKSADLEQSITLAHKEILFGQVPLTEVKRAAGELLQGPIPYSTHDLAVSAALVFFKKPECVPMLTECQIPARMQVLNWTMEGKVVRPLAESFEAALYKLYKPDQSRTPERAVPNPAAKQKMQAIQKLAEITTEVIDLQLNLANKTSDDVKYHRWSLGYCFGALDSVAQLAGFDRKTDGFELITQGFARIMSEGEAEQYVRRCLELQEDHFFAEGRDYGGNDLYEWQTTKGEFKPLMLMNFFVLGKPAPFRELR